MGSPKAEPGQTRHDEPQSTNRDKSMRRFHLIFEIGVLAKGIDGAVEFVGGVLLLFLSPDAIWRVAYYLIQDELIEDPSDPFANWVLNFVPKVIETKFSASGFLLIHGIVKLGLVAGLATNRLWSYPAGILVFGAFTAYQLYEFTQKHSAFFGVVTILDVLVIFLIAIEYQHVRRAKRLT
jgi:uncharacterized membrane protein